MVQQITDNLWQAEARSEQTKKFIQDIKKATRASLPRKRRSPSF
jgi:hypothetical protein